MTHLDTIHELAIQHTKNKVTEDIEKFLGPCESLPNVESYLDQRKTYLSQIWVNVWLTKAGNDFSKRDKKAFLSENDYNVEGMDRKLVNKLFRNEIRGYKPFAAMTWVKEAYTEAEWEKAYGEARKKFLKKQEEERLAGQRASMLEKIEELSSVILESTQEDSYLRLRHEIARELENVLRTQPRFKYIELHRLEERLTETGIFDPSDYRTLADFFEELTGDIHHSIDWGRHSFEYETYHYYFDRKLAEYFSIIGAEQVLAQMPPEVFEKYETIFGKKLDLQNLKTILENSLYMYIDGFIYKLEEEYVSDLLEIAGLPYEEEVHRELYNKHLKDRERRRAEEQAELERKQAEEARMLEDIFGREYNPSVRRNIKYTLHIGETNTGKTHHALETMKAAESGIYLAPLRLLALEVHEKLNSEGVPCSLKTGEEEKLVEGAAHISCTVEMFHERDFYHVVVIDESQMIADKDRGFSWYKAITKANADEVHIIGSRNIEKIMLGLLGDSDVKVIKYSRDIPLQVESREFALNDTGKGDALVCFSRRQVLENASRLQNNGRQVSMIYGSMPPETRKKQIQRFIQGETSVVVATDAIGMGLNLPIRRIVFLENEKFDGTRRRRLTSQEVKQIAGRAGRKGIYNVGKVAFSSDVSIMKKLLEKEDHPVETFSIAPTSGIFERFQKYSRSLEEFFELWDRFESPKGTKKASLSEERELYEYVKGTEIEAMLPMMELYGYLHLPFASKEPALIEQWLETIKAITAGTELPEPAVKTGTLEELELSYKAIGLHLLFLYKLGKRTEAVYWERVRTGLSDDVHEYLKTKVKNYKKKCRHCGKGIHTDSPYQICDACHSTRYRNKNRSREWRG